MNVIGSKFFVLIVFLAGSVLSTAVIVSPSGDYFLGDNIFIAGYYEGQGNCSVSLFLDNSLVTEKNYSFEGVTDFRTLFPEKLNASPGEHFVKISSNCFEDIKSSFKVSDEIKVSYSLNSFKFMTGEEVRIKAYGVKGKETVPCKILSEGTVYESEMNKAFSTPGEKQVQIKCMDGKGNKGEKNITLEVYDSLKAVVYLNKKEFEPGEEVEINLTATDYFGRKAKVSAYALLDNEKYFFTENNGRYFCNFTLPENQQPGTYEVNIFFNKGNNKGNYSFNITVENIVTDAKLIIDEKKSNESTKLIKVVVLNQNNNPFIEKINVTIEYEGTVTEKQVETNKYFKVPAGAKITVKGKSFEFKKQLPNEKEESKKLTGLATGTNENFKGFAIGSVLFILIVGSILFLRSSELMTGI